MELESIIPFLENKSILVIGAAGFLAKIFVEKVLRVQPKVKKLYLLLRAADAKSASHRLQNEVFSKDLFRILREKWGGNINSYISEKVTPVAGDISFDDMGLKDLNLRDEMFREVDIIVNLAASTNFDERYDVALGLNTLGAKHVLNFAKKCLKLKVFVHVSTAYVSGEKAGIIMEDPYTLTSVPSLDVDFEKKLIEEKLMDLKSQGASEETIQLAMKDFGVERAKVYGWPNTYVFTKAMGEMLLGHLKGNMPLVILRPTIITSTYKEPFPGWVEGVRTIDSIVVGYGKGKLTCFLGGLTSVIDVIPADMVVNSIIVAMVAHANLPCDNAAIYHVGSSVSNPFLGSMFKDFSISYFSKKPWINKDGKPVQVGEVTVLSSMASFHQYMTLRYILPLKGLQLVNTASCQYFQRIYTDLNRKIKFVMRLVELYKPYLFFEGVYDDMNTEKLRIAAEKSGVETDLFYFDPKIIKWDDYFMNIHYPGIVKYVFK